jgi:biotin operon repressor
MEREMSRGIIDKRTKGWFWLDNYIMDLGLKPNAVAVYAVLCRMAGDENRTVYPSHAYIGEKLAGMSRPTVIKAIKELSEKGLIEVGNRKKKGQNTNYYILLDRVAKGKNAGSMSKYIQEQQIKAEKEG